MCCKSSVEYRSRYLTTASGACGIGLLNAPISIPLPDRYCVARRCFTLPITTGSTSVAGPCRKRLSFPAPGMLNNVFFITGCKCVQPDTMTSSGYGRHKITCDKSSVQRRATLIGRETKNSTATSYVDFSVLLSAYSGNTARPGRLRSPRLVGINKLLQRLFFSMR